MKILEFNPQNNMNINHRKENYFQYEYSIIVFDEKTKKFSAPVILRIYITPSINYACVWGIEKHFESSDKGSAFQMYWHTALKALRNAGFVFEDTYRHEDISEYMTLIAEYFGYKNYYIHKSNP